MFIKHLKTVVKELVVLFFLFALSSTLINLINPTDLFKNLPLKEVSWIIFCSLVFGLVVKSAFDLMIMQSQKKHVNKL